MTHAIDSPSALSRRRRCPGSRRLEQLLGVPRESSAAASGTHTHHLIECCLIDDQQPAEFIGKTLTSEAGEFIVDAERAERAAVLVDYVNDRARAGDVVEIHPEVQVDAGLSIGRADMRGTSDVVLILTDGLEVIDYKDGYEPVEVIDNDQLLSYLTGALVSLGSKDVKTLRMTVVQPRMTEQGRPAITHCDVTEAALLEWAREVKADLEAADESSAPLTPGEVQCRWCSAAGACVARATQALTGVTFPVVAADAPLQAKADALGSLASFDPALLNDEQLVSFLEGIPVAREVFKQVEAYARQLMAQGHTLDGYYLKKTYGNRSWVKDAKKTESALRRHAGLKKADMIEQKLRSPTQILRLKSLTEEQRTWVEDHLVVRKETGAKIAHVSEQGESALPHAPEGMFEPVTPAFLQPPTGE